MRRKAIGYSGFFASLILANGILAFSKGSFTDFELVEIALVGLTTLVSLTLIVLTKEIKSRGPV